MSDDSIEVRVGRRRLIVQRWNAERLDVAEARELSPTEAGWDLSRITDVRALVRVIGLIHPHRSLVDLDRFALIREVESLVQRGRLRVSVYPPLQARAGGRPEPRADIDDPREPSEPIGEDEERHWIVVRLVDTQGRPLRKMKYVLELPNQEKRQGYLDQNGFLRVDGLPPGSCKISFPDYDASTWEFPP